MAFRVGFYTLLVIVLCCALFAASEASYIPKPAGFSAQALKRSVITGSRQKRYTDYQERASAFCTGLCMYEERKSYSECFDLCNWNHQQPSYSRPSAPQSDYEQYPDLTSESETDYMNDGAAEPEAAQQQSNRQDGTRNGKGKKGRSKGLREQRQRNREELARQKQVLRELKRKLMQEINEKKSELTDKAVTLQEDIRRVEEEIELNKQTMQDLEDRLETIDAEMNKIDELKTNLSSLVKDRRKVLLEKLQDPNDGIADEFLIPEGQSLTQDGELSNVVKEFLIHDKMKRIDGNEERFATLSKKDQRFPLYEAAEETVVKRKDVLNDAASNLEGLFKENSESGTENVS